MDRKSDSDDRSKESSSYDDLPELDLTGEKVPDKLKQRLKDKLLHYKIASELDSRLFEGVFGHS